MPVTPLTLPAERPTRSRKRVPILSNARTRAAVSRPAPPPLRCRSDGNEPRCPALAQTVGGLRSLRKRAACARLHSFSDNLLEDVAVEREIRDDCFSLYFSLRSDRNSRSSWTPQG
jgi:uncharacterized protein YjiS (DUF1127 family)